MIGFRIRTHDNVAIRFRYYNVEAPITCAAFDKLLPFSRLFCHARLSGEEIWTDNAPSLDIIQENASVFTIPGEVVIGPKNPMRTKTTNCLGVYYGEGKGLDCCNIFALVFEEDLPLLKLLGENIWKQGTQQLLFESI